MCQNAQTNKEQKSPRSLTKIPSRVFHMSALFLLGPTVSSQHSV